MHALWRFVKEGADPNATDENGDTALIRAIRDYRTGRAKSLIRAGVDVNIADRHGQTPLIHTAIVSPQPDIALLLLERGANIHAVDNVGDTALMGATSLFREQWPIWNSLAHALFFGAPGILCLLLDGFKANTATVAWLVFGCFIALSKRFAVWDRNRGANTIVRALIDAGAPTGAALLNAVHYGNAIGVKRLIAAGADIHATNENGETALQLAKKAGHADISRMLERAGARS